MKHLICHCLAFSLGFGQDNPDLVSVSWPEVYPTERNGRIAFGVDEKTYRKWVWKFIELLGNIDVVSAI